jgi:hypothetical protein
MFGGKKRKEEEKEQLIENYMRNSKLDKLNEDDKHIIRDILKNYAGNTFLKVQAILKGDSIQNTLIQQNEILINQNWIIIRKLDEINKKLEGK